MALMDDDVPTLVFTCVYFLRFACSMFGKSSKKYSPKWWWKMVMNPMVESVRITFNKHTIFHVKSLNDPIDAANCLCLWDGHQVANDVPTLCFLPDPFPSAQKHAATAAWTSWNFLRPRGHKEVRQGTMRTAVKNGYASIRILIRWRCIHSLKLTYKVGPYQL